jgi:enoyl-CoA hydratase
MSTAVPTAHGIVVADAGNGIVEVVMDAPPVNALTAAGWFALADALTAAGADPATRVVVLRAEGRGFNAWTSRRSRPARTTPRSSA